MGSKAGFGLCGALVWTLATAAGAQALDPGETDPKQIMQAVEDRDDGDKRTSRMSLKVTDASGRSLTRAVRGRSMDFAEGEKSLMLFEAPADVRNTGLLSIDYDAADKDDDQWLYLPSLHKSTRISTSEKSGSFLGTDITYADMTSRNVENYSYKLLSSSEKVDGEDCWVIETRPNAKEAKETGYVKSHVWVSKQKLMVVQAKNWVKEGRKLKYMKFTGFRQVDGIWVAENLQVRVVKGNKLESETTLHTSDIRFNQEDVKESDFTQRRLEKGL